MKKFTLQLSALFIFLFITTAVMAQLGASQWKYINPKPFGFWGSQISYADDNTALVVGEWGGIAKTTDGGGTWQYFAYTTTNNAGELLRPSFNDVQFVNSTLAYAVGANGVMIKSYNGGIDWSFVTTPFYSVTNNEYNEIHTVCFVSADTGYIGGYGDSASNRATIYKTTNGGASWQAEFQFPAPTFSWQKSAIYKIRFSPSGVGYAGGANGLVWKYQSGVWSDYSISDATVYPNVNANDTSLIHWGTEPTDTFTQVSTYQDNIYGLGDQNYRAIAIVNDTAVVVGTQQNGGFVRINTAAGLGSYWLINNGGSLAPQYHSLNSPSIYNAICRNGNNVAAASGEGKVLVSADKGFTWRANDVYAPGTNEAGLEFWGIDISPSGRVGVCGKSGVIADSTTQWRRPYKFFKKPAGGFFGGGYALTSIHFLDANYGVAAGTAGAMIRTADGGNNWEDISNPGFSSWDRYTSVVYPSTNTIIASASNGQLYKSLDRGTSFDLLYSEPTGTGLDGMDFINEDTGWLLTTAKYPDNVNFIDTFHQFIYHTTDGGMSWDTSTTVFPYNTDYSLIKKLSVIKFLNSNIGYAGGEKGSLYKTTNGGLTWVNCTIPVNAADKPFTSIAIVDENVVYVSGNRSFVTGGAMVMKTLDGGNTWTMCNTGLPENSNLPKILMYNASEGLAFSTGVVYATKDGGASWVPYYTNYSNFLGEFEGASFVPIPGCIDGICRKVFAVAGANIMKLDADVVLPVKFSNLTGSGTSRGNQLFWTAFSQESVQYFEIQRSSDGANFQKIGDRQSPSRLTQQAYQWLDANTSSSRNFYRIKAVENTGLVYYTNVVVITNTKRVADWNHQVSNGSLILNNIDVQKGAVLVQVINTAGQIVAAKSWKQNGGAFNDMVVLPSTAKGIYFVRINNEGAQKNFQIFIQ